MPGMTKAERELLQVLRHAHLRLDRRDIARGITRYQLPIQGGFNGNQHTTDTE